MMFRGVNKFVFGVLSSLQREEGTWVGVNNETKNRSVCRLSWVELRYSFRPN